MLDLPAGEGMLLSEFLVGGVSTLSSAPPGRRHIHRNQKDNQQQTDCSQTLHHPTTDS
jgi:hypothetical protein